MLSIVIALSGGDCGFSPLLDGIEVLKEAAAAFGNKDVRYVEGWDLFDKEDEVNVSRMPDKLHPNAAGMLLWGQRVLGLSTPVCTPP